MTDAGNAKPKLVASADRSLDKRAKFVELAQKRTQAAIEKIALLGNLANKGAYEWTDADLKKIERAIEGELENVKTKFAAASGGKKQQDTFKL